MVATQFPDVWGTIGIMTTVHLDKELSPPPMHTQFFQPEIAAKFVPLGNLLYKCRQA